MKLIQYKQKIICGGTVVLEEMNIRPTVRSDEYNASLHPSDHSDQTDVSRLRNDLINKVRLGITTTFQDLEGMNFFA